MSDWKRVKELRTAQLLIVHGAEARNVKIPHYVQEVTSSKLVISRDSQIHGHPHIYDRCTPSLNLIFEYWENSLEN